MKINNKLKSKLLNNDITIGSWLTISSQELIEIFAQANFEWLTIDLEHASISIESVINLIGHIQGNGMQALVRVSKNEEVVIKRVLDAGADGVIVPMIKTKQDAEKAVSFVKYPPEGKRGVGLNRAQNYGPGFNKYKEWVEKDVVIIAQIEHIDSVNNLEDIFSVKGIDGIIVGPYDLSASMGFPGDYNRKDVKEALLKIENISNALNKPLGYHVIESEYKEVLLKIKSGYKFIAFSMDFLFFGNIIRNQMKNLKSNL
jgi:2-dehydro-3-deoxyglucarate aldolase